MASPNLHVIEQLEEKPSAALIFLHGTGESGESCRSAFIKFLGAPGHSYIKIYFPTAPTTYLTIRDTVTSNWFDVIRTGPKNGEVEGNLDDADRVTQMIEEKIQEIIKNDGIPRERIIIGGNSQGGMVMMYAAYMRGVKCGAVVAIAANLPFKKSLLPNATVPVLSVYGEKDAFIDPDVMASVWAKFRANKIPFTAKSLQRGGHTMDFDYAKCMFDWLEKKFPPPE